MLFSIKMRSSLGGCHGEGGRHISGAERIVKAEDVDAGVLAMLRRAREHERGSADFIQVKVEEIRPGNITYCPLLSVSTRTTRTKGEGRRAAEEELVRTGVSSFAAAAGIRALESLADSLHGAMVLDALSGKRLDGEGVRGVRCSNMDCEDTEKYETAMRGRGLGGDHPREALVLASKVASAPGTVAELCWSDDPQYVTGYVASPRLGYRRITVMKDKGDPVGGRVFFVRPGTDMEKYKEYLQNRTVLVRMEEK